MLQIETVEPGTFSILKMLMKIPELKDFHLVGGTALSLKYGHRISVDLDLFNCQSFENSLIEDCLIDFFGQEFKVRNSNPKIGIFSFIEEVKIDLIKHPFPMIKPIQEIEGIRFFSTEDIIAMKVQAILGRGKKKDFWDISELLQHYSVADFIQFHKEKYQRQNLLISVPQALIYFGDAEESEDPVSLKGQTWKKVKKSIEKKVRDFLI
ncbi:Nucleotidyl transferase AbiEii toxin, Type IV TA system [Aquiflexum balticum DSM 16537]|uniref:Nucleotidyl transferase AbiEii toxin, Type IV TA system n=2 Tax=Aquiflexum TaxID=280472 RepID=A0A1W2H015_9BACT|nr:Nucleotidyl transferase AbiEii toxin, Type IV TA system [Aquiflexum balticum DSM 16537]